jgi:pimeloyl-ACP methyl ester carboxylesterase
MKLILLPGLDGTGELFTPFVAALSGQSAQVVRYPPDQAMDYARHEAFVRDLLPREGDFVLLAESFSGPIGISIAASPPPGLRGLILCATFASNPHRRLGSLGPLVRWLPALRVPPSWAEPWLYSGRGTPELRRWHANAIRLVSARALRARVVAILGVDVRTQLAQVSVPMLYLRAARDRLVAPASSHEILELRPDVELVEFDAPHFLLQTEPAACAAAVLAFLERCSPRGLATRG